MAQQRYINFGDTVLAQRINEISTALVVPGVLSGAEMTVGLGGKSVDIAPHKVMLNELLLDEDAKTNLVISDPLPMDATDYTIVYEHNNQQVQGGVPALLFVREGLIGFNDIPNTVVVGWVRWTGTGNTLQPEMFIEAPKLQITNPSEFPSDVKVPPFTSSIYTRDESPAPGSITLTDFFDAPNLQAALELDNPSASIASIENLFPFVAGLQPPNRVIIEAQVPLGGTVTVSLLDEDNNEYLGTDATITNTAGDYTFREVQIPVVDTDQFTQNRPYYVRVVTQLNPGKQARISLVGTSSNFLPI